MPAGHVAALAGSPPGADAVLEVDEGYLGRLIDETSPRVVVLLNLSRDQLDRISEVRMLVDRWRAALGGLPGRDRRTGRARWWWPTPTIRWWCGPPAPAPDVRWVGAGQVWHNDAVGCPACGGRIVFGPGGSGRATAATSPGRHRDAWLEGRELVTGRRRPLAGRHRPARASSTGPTRPWRPWPPR